MSSNRGSPHLRHAPWGHASTAGVSCRGGRLTITNCHINNNTACGIEGAWASGLTIINCTINDNSYGIGCGESMLRVSNCSIKNNSHIYGGVGLSCSGSKLTITNCSISNNNGCGFEGYGSILRIDKCNISSNGDSGIFSDRSILMISNSTISENLPELDWADGGAILTGDSTASITNCTIVNNKAADEYGSGVSCWDSELKIKNSILYDNEATIGPEVYLGSDSIAWVNYTDVQGGPNDVYVKPGSILNWGVGNIDSDPCFVEPGYWVDACDPNIIVEPNDPNAMWIEGDYHLLDDSPCIDAGDPNYTAGPNETDLEGNPRVVDGDNDGNSVVDMGAYEVQVAEPAELILELADDVMVLNLHEGITNSLMAKLNSALAALEDENENNDAAAINLLEAFINAVEAQRGKKIPQPEADDLIAAAQQIIDLLSDG